MAREKGGARRARGTRAEGETGGKRRIKEQEEQKIGGTTKTTATGKQGNKGYKENMGNKGKRGNKGTGEQVEDGN